MIWDVLIALGVTFSQVALAWLGLRVTIKPPKEKFRHRIVIAFVVVSLLGIVMIAIGTARNSVVQQGISAALIELRARFQGNTGAPPDDVKLISNNDLTLRSINVASQMREIQNDYYRSSMEALRGSAGNINKFGGIRDQFRDRFMRTLQPKARLLFLEVLRRSGIDPPYSSDVYMRCALLIDGLFAGPSPIGSGADCLEDYARKLP
jgi:hypothetical protein